MTTDPNRPSDPMPPNPNDPMPPAGPPPTGPPSPMPPTTPPPVGAGDPYAQPSGAGGYAAPPPAEGTGYGAPQSPPSGTGFTPQPPAATSSTAPTGGQRGSSVSFNRAKASTYDLGLAAAAVLFLIAMILPWVSVSLGPGFGSVSASGFDIGRLSLALILLIVAAGIALLPAFDVNVTLPVQRSFILLGLTGLAAIITLTAFIEIVTSDGAGAGFGAWLGMLVVLGAVALSFLVFRSEQTGHTVAT